MKNYRTPRTLADSQFDVGHRAARSDHDGASSADLVILALFFAFLFALAAGVFS